MTQAQRGLDILTRERAHMETLCKGLRKEVLV